MIYKLILLLVVVFSLKTFSADQSINKSKLAKKKSLSTKQLQIIIKSVNAGRTGK